MGQLGKQYETPYPSRFKKNHGKNILSSKDEDDVTTVNIPKKQRGDTHSDISKITIDMKSFDM